MRKILTGCAAVLALAACGDDGGSGPAGPTGRQPIPPGSFSFSLPAIDGQPAGAFRAAGAVELDGMGLFELGDWAFGEFGPNPTAPLEVYASAPGADGRFHYLRMSLPREVQPGTVLPIRFPCVSRPDCAGFQFILDWVSVRSNADPRAFCGLGASSSGSVRIATREARRITGTFTAEVLCSLYRDPSTVVSYTVTDGSFDVPIVQPSDYAPSGT